MSVLLHVFVYSQFPLVLNIRRICLTSSHLLILLVGVYIIMSI